MAGVSRTRKVAALLCWLQTVLYAADGRRAAFTGSVYERNPQATRVLLGGQAWHRWEGYVCQPGAALKVGLEPATAPKPHRSDGTSAGPQFAFISKLAVLQHECASLKDCQAFEVQTGTLYSSECDMATGALLPEQHAVMYSRSLELLEQGEQPKIWPLPLEVSSGARSVAVSPAIGLTGDITSAQVQAAFARLKENTVDVHPLPPQASEGDLTEISVSIVDAKAALQLYVDESYELSIPGVVEGVRGPNAITISAQTVFGAVHALETLSQLIEFDFDSSLYVIGSAPWMIKDTPRFSHRGVLIDSSRHFQPVKSMLSVLRSMTYAKVNVLHWHIVDAQSFPVIVESHPELAQDGAYSKFERYSVQDVQHVVSAAETLGIRVMVEVDTPGHASSWCKSHPEVCPSPDCDSPLNPATNATFDLIEDIFTDFSHIFFEGLMHLGGDEVNTACWESVPEVSEWLQQNNFTANEAYMYFVNRAQEIARGLDKQVVGWEEIWNNFGTKLDPSTIIHQWLPGSTVGPEVVANGYRLLWSTDGVWYLDGLGVTWEDMYVADPCEGIDAAGCQRYVLGGEGCMWGETVDGSDIQQTIWPRLGAIAERLWSPASVNSTELAQPRIANFRCLLNGRGVAAAPYSNDMARSAPPGPGACLAQ